MANIISKIRKGNTTYDVRDYVNEARFSGGVLKVANGGTGGNSGKNAILALGVYPVGSIYMSVNSTNPGTLFGGTWTQLKDTFLLAAGDTYAANATGGAASASYTPAGTVGNTALTSAQIPAHTHSFTPAGSVASHTHKFTPSGSITRTQMHTHAFTGTGHTHELRGSNHASSVLYIREGTSTATVHFPSTGRWLKAGSSFVASVSTPPSGESFPYEQLVTSSTAAGGTNGVNASTLTWTGTEGTTQAAQPTFTGTAGTTGSTGSSGAHTHGFTGTAATINTMPPYLAVYVWKRTA